MNLNKYNTLNVFRKFDNNLYIQAANKPVLCYTIFQDIENLEELEINKELKNLNCEHEYEVCYISVIIIILINN